MNTKTFARLVLPMIAAGAAMAGCLPNNSAGPGAQSTLPVIAVEPTGSPTGGPGDLIPIPPDYPGTAKAYAEAVVDAWQDHEIDWLGDLTTAEVQEQILEIPQPLDMDWEYLRCDGTAGSSYCMFTNNDGDEFTLRITHSKLDQAHAAIEVKLDLTEFPETSVAYVKEFVKAWQIGNTTRMLKLSKQSVVDEVGPNAPTTPSYPKPTCCGGGLEQVKVNWPGHNARFDVGTTQLGGPNAIKDYVHSLPITQG